MPSSPNTFLFNNFQPVVQHRRITAGQIIGKTSACECSSSRAIRCSRETMSVLTIKRNEEFKRYSVMGGKGRRQRVVHTKSLQWCFEETAITFYSTARAGYHSCQRGWFLECQSYFFWKTMIVRWKFYKIEKSVINLPGNFTNDSDLRHLLYQTVRGCCSAVSEPILTQAKHHTMHRNDFRPCNQTYKHLAVANHCFYIFNRLFDVVETPKIWKKKEKKVLFQKVLLCFGGFRMLCSSL